MRVIKTFRIKGQFGNSLEVSLWSDGSINLCKYESNTYVPFSTVCLSKRGTRRLNKLLTGKHAVKK